MRNLVKEMFSLCIDQLRSTDALPYVTINPQCKNVIVPDAYKNQPSLVLNVSTNAAVDLEINENDFSFKATFNQVSFLIQIPWDALIGIYDQRGSFIQSFEYDMFVKNLDQIKSSVVKAKSSATAGVS